MQNNRPLDKEDLRKIIDELEYVSDHEKEAAKHNRFWLLLLLGAIVLIGIAIMVDISNLRAGFLIFTALYLLREFLNYTKAEESIKAKEHAAEILWKHYRES